MVLLIAQFGVIVHRIEHYIAPDHMECGEDACIAFSPSPPATEPIVFIPAFVFVFFYLRFWAVCAKANRPAGADLGFRAHAPPL